MTTIEWTDETWNPTTGCDRISPGCDHCYALTMAARLKGMGSAKYQNDGDSRTSGPGFALTVHPDTLDAPMRWRKPRKVFVNSMSDLFHQDVPDDFIARVFAVMALTPQHTYQVLTKRPQRMARLLRSRSFVTLVDDHRGAAAGDFTWPLPNVWLGTSIETDRYAFRADHLRSTPAAVRFISAEPLLGPLPSLDLTDIDWLIVGGESGPEARPMVPDWVRDLRERCMDVNTGTRLQFGTSFFFKQWGTWLPYEPDAQPPFWNGQHPDHQLVDGHSFPAMLTSGDIQDGWLYSGKADLVVWRRLGKHAAGRELDGRTWDEYPTP